MMKHAFSRLKHRFEDTRRLTAPRSRLSFETEKYNEVKQKNRVVVYN